MAMLLSDVQAEVQSWADSVNGKYLDYDGGYGAQCVDPALHYAAAVHGYQRIRGHGAFLAGNYIDKYGWGDISVRRMQAGDMVSLSWGGYYGHVMILLRRLSDGRWLILDQNSRGTGDDPSGPCEIRTVSLSSGVVRVARPPRYMGATASAPTPDPTPTPAPVPELTAAQILAGRGAMDSDLVLFNADDLVAAAKRASTPLYLAAALIRQESSGRNIYGNDEGGIYGTDANTPPSYTKTVTEANYNAFLSQLLSGNEWTGRTSNGVGPAQITHWSLHRDARNEGLRLWVPEDNMFFGLRLFAQYLGGDYSEASVKLAATRYNAGPAVTTPNAYGQKVWEWAVKYKAALAGAADTGGATPPPPAEPTVPELPGVPATEDPGPLPVLLALADTPPPPLPDPAPGKLPRRGRASSPLARIRFRDTYWSPAELNLRRALQIPGPDQSPLGAPIVAATGELVLARPVPLSDRGWSLWHDDPPRDGEPVVVEISDDGGWTWWRKFVGSVRGVSGSVSERGISVEVTDKSRKLARRFSHFPLNFRQPSPLNGWQYMRIGLHPSYYANYAARQAGFYSTPPMVGGTTMVSVPMVGSMWPERGTATLSRTLNAKGMTEGVPSDSPEYRRTWWGMTTHNVFSVYQPAKVQTWAGRLTTAHGVRALVGPVTSTISAVELWWDRVSITTMISTAGVAVEIQSGWNSDGTRRKAFERIRPLSAEQIEKGFELKVWLLPNGVITMDVDGSKSTHTALPEWPRETRTTDMSDVRILAPAKGAPLGGVQVVGDPTEGSFGPWERTFILDADPDHMIWGMSALEKVSGLEILTEMAEAALDSTWVDEDGLLWYVSRARMDARASVRTLRLPDLLTAPGKVHPDSVHATVEVTRQQPSLYQSRLDSRAGVQVWEGPKDTLEPGGKWEQIVRTPDNEDWFYPDVSFDDVVAGAVARVNRGLGSWVGGTVLNENGDSTNEAPAPQSWFYGSAVRVTYRAWRIVFGYTPPAGVTAELSLSNPELPGLAKRRQGNGPVLRARGLQTWEDMDPVTVKTGARLDDPTTYTHNGGRWIQSKLQARRIAQRIAPMLAQPLPAWGPVVMGQADLSLRLGDTVTLDMWGTRRPQRLSGEVLSMSNDGVLTQTLSFRQLRP